MAPFYHNNTAKDVKLFHRNSIEKLFAIEQLVDLCLLTQLFLSFEQMRARSETSPLNTQLDPVLDVIS